MNKNQFLLNFKNKLETELEKKNSWGKNEIKKLFSDLFIETLIENIEIESDIPEYIINRYEEHL